MRDIAGNFAAKVARKLTVDTIAPEIEQLEWSVSGKSLNIKIAVSETVDLSYLDSNDNEVRGHIVCSNCEGVGYDRSKSVHLRAGEHNLTFIARDKAGNTDTYSGILVEIA